MSKQEDPLAVEIRYELMPGRYVKWDEMSRLVHNLDRVHEKVEGLVKAGEPERAVKLFEIFMAGVYAKIEEADDECDLAMLFHSLACGWIQARQAAGRPAEERAMATAETAGLENFIPLCVKAKEWDRLARRIHASTPAELESLSHYTAEPAAGGLAKHDPLAAAKLYRALGLSIVNSGKSKYYGDALAHFKKARDLFLGLGLAAEWEALAQAVQMDHSRKSGFLSAFKKIVSVKLRPA